ncbi:MAG TPA: DUF4172 domain-containing protein [Deltaproteobacteria bacterium]|nr:DUF4172 domain-containing protein [Deltaproteobacteria bacterium]
MKWNWQKSTWPHFTYQDEGLSELETEFQRRSGVFSGAVKYVKNEEKSSLMVEFLSTEAVKTSEIEGEILNRDSVQSSIQRHFGLKGRSPKIPPAEQGIADMMVSLYGSFQKTLSHDQLFSWHEMLMKGRRDLRDIGGYRSDPEPMQVVSGPLHRTRVHFEAPPSRRVHREMSAFIRWFNATAPGKKTSLPALIRAGIAHLYFVSIHPFADGNGRIGRAISEKALSQSLGRPTLIALSQTIAAKRKHYYRHLELNNKDKRITDWLIYFAKTVLEAQAYTQRLLDFLIEKTKLFEKLQDRLNTRQKKALDRMFREGLKGFAGGLSAENYLSITKTSRATATRDLQELVEWGALKKTGELKYTRYFLRIAA